MRCSTANTLVKGIEVSEVIAQQKATGLAEVVPPQQPPTTGTLTIEERARELAERAGHIRNVTEIVGDDAAALQHEALRIQLDARTSQLSKQDPAALLGQLSDLGFAWRDLARMLGVSVPAVRRWRTGELPSGENRRLIAQLLAFAQIIRDDHFVFEPASWMEVPIVRDSPVTPIDLYATGHLEVVHDLAAEKCSPEAALDAAEPDWREKYRNDWEVATDEDGQRFIRPKPGR